MTVSYFLQTLVTGISSGMVSYMMVAGMSLIIGGMNMVNFGQGAFSVLGTHLCYSLAPVAGFISALIIIPFVVGFLGWFVERAVRPLFDKNMLYIVLLAFGAAYIMCDAMVMVWRYSIRLLTLPRFLNGSITIFGIRFPVYYLLMIVVGALIAFAFWSVINKTKLGMLMRAIIKDREMVAYLGINVNRLFSIMLTIGMGIAGLGGMINIPITGMSPKEGLSIFGNIMPILMIGGMRDMNGCLPVTSPVGLVSAFGVTFSPQFYNLLPTALTVICMFIGSSGVFSKKEA